MNLARNLLSAAVLSIAATSAAQAASSSAFRFEFTAIGGEPMPLSQYEGKVVLLVNTASFCGFTRQYSGLQALWEKYRDDGLVVVGVPSNDFGSQEPGTEDEIKKFCEVNFSIDFPLTRKESVKGENAHPFYQWAAQELGARAKPRWNFHKYLVARDGRLVDWFSTMTAPSSKKLVGAVEAQLAVTGQ